MKSIAAVAAMLVTLCLAHRGQTDAVSDWQARRLLAPTERELRQEQLGQVFIYDGLDQPTVERGLDNAFERIEHMMFIRTRLPPTAPGDIEIVEDDCD